MFVGIAAALALAATGIAALRAGAGREAAPSG